MYLNHFGLDEPPFRITPHTDFFFAGANRGATLEALLYAITHDEGIVKVSGDVGSGKTMLCRVLMERVPGHVDTILLSNPSLAREEIPYAIADELNIDSGGQRPPLLLRTLQDHLIQLYSQGRRVVVLIDEAHAMPQETLEQIRLLSNLETSHAKLLQIVLFGQPELDEHLNLPQMRPLKERITHSFRLQPLARSDIGAYLDFRMRAAGYRGPKVFTPEAVRRILKASQGLTRRVNILANKSLLAAFADNQHGITARHVDRAIRDSEFHHPAMSKTGIAVAASGVAAGLALGIGLHYLLSPSAPTAAAQPAAIGTPRAQPAAVMPAVSVATPSAAAAAPGGAGAMPAIAASRVQHATPVAVSAAPGSQNYVPPPPPAGTLTRARFDATQEWLKGAPGDHYSIQLFTADVHDLHAVEGLLARAAAKNLGLSDFHIYGVKIDERQHYRLAYGIYSTFAEANQGVRNLPAVYRQSGTYLRSVERMRSQNRQ